MSSDRKLGLDVVLARQIYPSQVWLNQGNGTFTLATELPSAVAVQAADVNGDGKADLLLRRRPTITASGGRSR